MPPFYFIGISISIAYFFQKTHKIKPERSVWIGCDFLGKEKGKKEKREKKENHSRRTRERQTGGTALCLLRGMGIAFAITCIIFIGFGMILTYTTASEESLPLVSLICTALSAAAAGSATELENKLANPSFYAKINFVINGIKGHGSFR